jgi:hypothetical protein
MGAELVMPPDTHFDCGHPNIAPIIWNETKFCPHCFKNGQAYAVQADETKYKTAWEAEKRSAAVWKAAHDDAVADLAKAQTEDDVSSRDVFRAVFGLIAFGVVSYVLFEFVVWGVIHP